MKGLTRPTRRRARKVVILAAVSVIGFAAPIWAPRLMAAMPKFHITDVKVSGTELLSPSEILAHLDLPETASVWDDFYPLEERLRLHEMIRSARILRQGFSGVLVEVVEHTPVALLATPDLRIVNGKGDLLPLNPSEVFFDLPIIGPSDVVPAQRIASAVDVLSRVNPSFLATVSEVEPADGGGLTFLMRPGGKVAQVVLPESNPARALERVSVALGQVPDRTVVTADARYYRQVVFTLEEVEKVGRGEED